MTSHLQRICSGLHSSFHSVDSGQCSNRSGRHPSICSSLCINLLKLCCNSLCQQCGFNLHLREVLASGSSAGLLLQAQSLGSNRPWKSLPNPSASQTVLTVFGAGYSYNRSAHLPVFLDQDPVVVSSIQVSPSFIWLKSPESVRIAWKRMN
jgi:hypothetical protein